MTPEQLREAAAVMLAAADGKAIESRMVGAQVPWGPSVRPCWDFEMFEYRIKPEFWKVRVAIYKNPADGYHLPIMDVYLPRYEGWERVSDFVEIEVKDE